MKPREFCNIVGISYRTFKRWVAEGRIRVVRTPTGRIRVPYSEVEQILGGRPGLEVKVEQNVTSRRQLLVEVFLIVAELFAEKFYGLESRKKEKFLEGLRKLLEEVEKGG